MKIISKPSISLLLIGTLIPITASAANYYLYDTSNATNINWSDIPWTTTEIGDNRDIYRLYMRNSEGSTVNIKGGNNVTLADGGSMSLNYYTNLVVGDESGDTKTSLTFTDAGKDT